MYIQPGMTVAIHSFRINCHPQTYLEKRPPSVLELISIIECRGITIVLGFTRKNILHRASEIYHLSTSKHPTHLFSCDWEIVAPFLLHLRCLSVLLIDSQPLMRRNSSLPQQSLHYALPPPQSQKHQYFPNRNHTLRIIQPSQLIFPNWNFISIG